MPLRFRSAPIAFTRFTSLSNEALAAATNKGAFPRLSALSSEAPVLGAVHFQRTSMGSISRALFLPPKPPSVCETCWKGPLAAQLGLLTTPITLNEERIVGGYSYSVSGLQLEHGSATGCALCTFLLAHGVPSRDARRQPVDQVKITLGSSGVPFCVPAKAQELNVVVNDEMSVFEGLVHTSSDDPAAPHIVARDPVLNVGSPRALSLAKALVNECVHGHERCIYISPPSDVRLPTRLVDCIDPARPRLASTGVEYGQYLALSYVWGEPQQHQTTMSNISAYADGIDGAFLPQTIHDAIHVTHSLGFRYLWVDSLCIVQDSDEDKLHELGRMHFIYRYAYLTIIAASAERVSAGFLQDRPAKDSTTLPFLCPPHPSALGESAVGTGEWQVGEVHVTARALSGAVAVYKNFDGMDPIHTRGWCLQELYLSPRALIFTSRTLRLRCQTATQNVGGSLYNTQNDVGLPDALFHPAPPPVAYGSAEWVDLHTRWWSIVDGYTRRALGHASDKLVACGALAEAFHRVLRTDYLAGLWRDTLLRDLIWSRAIRGTERPAVYRAPSWSWAAVDGEIIIHRIHHDMEAVAVAEVVRCAVTFKDPGLLFGEVAGGSLVLRAVLMPCKVRAADDFDGGYLLLSRREQGSEEVDGSVDGAVREDRKVRGRCLTDYIVDLREESEPKWLVPLLRRDGRFPLVWGLMVALETSSAASGTENGKVYRRIGAFHADCSWDALQGDRDSDSDPLPLVEIEVV